MQGSRLMDSSDPASRTRDFRRLEGAILSDERGTAVLKKQ
ncbi:hypothetical protein SBA5_70072 [Candidatus Sulfotelmatomonas gaucii]|uniref:Uncharacterized protein n=1 Tax=Candidatus Sulfuritelmatomonas gaucii TaxID=2043161 RepID=A0A2N9M0J4_9BACT|nr:hypothetical protein SBA5_70072 [Candidatus Sulfotelmatomonas gaucii]